MLDTPERITLFNAIADFVSTDYLPFVTSEAEPSAKRRRISNDASKDGNGVPVEGYGLLAPPPQAAPTHANFTKAAAGPQPTAGTERLLIELAQKAAEEVVLLEVKEVSVSIPQRKKYDLCFTKNYLYTKIVGTTAPVQGMVYDWSDIGVYSWSPRSYANQKQSGLAMANRHGQTEYVFYVPIPEKQQLQYNYVLFPRNIALSSTKSWPAVDFEPLVFTVPTTAPKAGVVAGYAAQTAAQVSDSYSSLMHWAINSQLTSVGNTSVSIVGTDPRVFHSALKQPHRAAEKAVHVKAFRGSKDGYLFFLPNGILWGFKKPLLFIPLDRVIALSYTNVLQRTFNIEIEVDVSHAPDVGQKANGQGQWANGAGGDDGDDGLRTEVIEFAMIDQEDYQTIDETYVRRHGLHNRSMAEGRRAKRQLRENARHAAGGDANGAGQGFVGGEGGEDQEMAELDRAEQILQDEEDEEEEDYDPGSEGESEGEGESSEEEDDDEEGGEGDEEAEGYDEDGVEEEGYVEDHE